MKKITTVAAVAALAAAAFASVGCSAVLRGPDTDHEAHLHLTYFMAREAGFDEREARDIAAANCYTDEHPETTSVATERRLACGLVLPTTIPLVAVGGLVDCALGGETLKRGFGRRVAQATAWSIAPLAQKLHFPALSIYEKVEPAFVTDRSTGEIYYNNHEAVAVLEQAFRALETHDPDVPRALALVGIGLHTLQDSYKHRGFCAAYGHIGSSPDADDITRDISMALQIAEATFHSLCYARRLLHGSCAAPSSSWKMSFERLYAVPARDEAERQQRWIALIRRSFGDDYRGWEKMREEWLPSRGDSFERAIDRIRTSAK